MATSVEFIEFFMDTLGELNEYGEVRAKKMFGECLVYYKNKPIFFLMDNIVYVKINETSTKHLPNAPTQKPWPMAKPYYIVENIENFELLSTLAIEIEKVTEIPKKKKTKLYKRD